MTVRLAHVLIPARDQRASAKLLADLLGVEVSGGSSDHPEAQVSVVRVEDVALEFVSDAQLTPGHYAFAADDETFDAILARVKQRGLVYSADALYEQRGVLNHNNGGRGFYARGPDNHNLEFFTADD